VARTRGVSTLSSPRVIATMVRELRELRPAILALEPLPETLLQGERP
jgi:hypothetical protein